MHPRTADRTLEIPPYTVDKNELVSIVVISLKRQLGSFQSDGEGKII